MPFLTLMNLPVATMMLNVIKLFFFTKKIDLSKKIYKNVQNFLFWYMRLLVPSFFLVPFLSFFSALLLSLPFAFHILSGCRKTLGVNCAHFLLLWTKPENGTLINYRYNGPFYHLFGTKTVNVVFQFAKSECRRYPKPIVVRIDLSLLYYLLIKNT